MNKLNEMDREEGFYDQYDEPTIESCSYLWNACLLFTIREALYASNYDEIYRRKAITWILSKNMDFNDVCHMSGYDPDIIRENFLKIHSRNNKRRKR